MKKLILSQTCQGTVIEKLLCYSTAFNQEFKCTFIPNYEVLNGKAQLATCDSLKESLWDCEVLIYHDVAHYKFASLIKRMPPNSIAIKIPYITSKIYWPSYDFKNPCWFSPRANSALIPWPCRKLNELIVSLKKKDKIVDAYMHFDFASLEGIEEDFCRQIDYLKSAEKSSIFDISSFVRNNFRSQQLFHLINHPALPVFLEVTNAILRHLNLEELNGFPGDPFGNHQMPVHPSIIRHYNLTWCDDNTQYLLLDKRLRFEEYVNFYVDCYIEKYGNTNFPPQAQRGRWPADPVLTVSRWLRRSNIPFSQKDDFAMESDLSMDALSLEIPCDNPNQTTVMKKNNFKHSSASSDELAVAQTMITSLEAENNNLTKKIRQLQAENKILGDRIEKIAHEVTSLSCTLNGCSNGFKQSLFEKDNSRKTGNNKVVRKNYLSTLFDNIQKKRNIRDKIERCKRSSVFDSAWYLSNYQDVLAANIGPVEHFVKFGIHERRLPNAKFNWALDYNKLKFLLD